jgi:hypothetical protein
VLSITQQKGEETVIKHKQLRRRPINKWKGRLTSEGGKGRQRPKTGKGNSSQIWEGQQKGQVSQVSSRGGGERLHQLYAIAGQIQSTAAAFLDLCRRRRQNPSMKKKK